LLEKILFTAKAAASLDKAAKSAPTNPGVRLAMRLKSKEPSKRNFLERTDNMRALAFSSGIPEKHKIKELNPRKYNMKEHQIGLLRSNKEIRKYKNLHFA